MGTKVSAATIVLPANLSTGDYVPVDDASTKQRLDISLLGAFTRLTGLTPYTTRAAALAGTSSASAIQTQIDALNTAGGGVALLDAGFFALGAALIVPSNVRLVGRGRGITTLVVKASTTTSTIGSGHIAFNAAVNASVENLTLDFGSMSTTGNGIVVTNGTTITGSYWVNYITFTGGVTFIEGETVVGGTSGATGRVCKINGTTGISLVNITGTFSVAETVTGRLSGVAGTNISAMANLVSKGCSVRSVEVIGKPNTDLQYMVWIKGCEDIIVIDCSVDGRTVTESGSTEFRLDSNLSMDQQGIEIVGSYNVNVTNNVVKNVTLAGIFLSNSEAAGNNNENIIVRNNTVVACGHGIYLYSWASSATVFCAQRSVVASDNVIDLCHKHGLRVGATGSFAAELFSNVTLSNNNVDLRGSKRDATNYGNFPLRVYLLTENISYGSRIVNNTFRGGGGKGASTTISSPNTIQDAHGWEIRDNIFDNNGDAATTTASGGSVRIQGSNDTLFQGNRITNPKRLSLVVSGSLRTTIINNAFKNPAGGALINGQAFTDVSMIEITASSNNTSFVGNTIDANGSTNPTVLGNNTGTGFEYHNNVYVGSTKAFYDTIYPYVAEAGTTQTHGFGSYSPADGGASFTITNGKIWKSSGIAIRQTAGTALAFKVSVADGSFVLTPSAVFAGTSTYQWQIIN